MRRTAAQAGTTLAESASGEERRDHAHRPALPGREDFELWFGAQKADGVAATAFIQTIPGRNFLATVRLCGTGDAFYDQTWKPDDLVRVR